MERDAWTALEVEFQSLGTTSDKTPASGHHQPKFYGRGKEPLLECSHLQDAIVHQILRSTDIFKAV